MEQSTRLTPVSNPYWKFETATHRQIMKHCIEYKHMKILKSAYDITVTFQFSKNVVGGKALASTARTPEAKAGMLD